MWKRGTNGRDQLSPGTKLGGYRLEEMLGEGAMGIVFRAVREDDGELAAVKVLKRQLAGDDVYRRRFVHEARAAREVTNSHLVPVLEAGEAEGWQFLATGYVPGRSLAQRIEADGPLAPSEIRRLALHVAAGLDALHGKGLVHRDVKPSNIMLRADDGAAMVTDFGLAKGRAYTVLTKPGQVVGTLDYLAPELIKGSTASPASDVYALGCTVYECVAGRPPFAAKSVFQVGLAHLEEEPPDPAVDRDDVPYALAWAVLQALAKEPERRPPSAMAYARMVAAAIPAEGR
jgi:serine/threonine protein kinase